MKKSSLFVLMAFVVFSMTACDDQNPKESGSEVAHHEEKHEDHDHEHGHGHGHGETANDHMHKSSTEDLINRFESPERDEYQKPEKVIEFLGNLEGKKIMDIGAGSGYFSVKLAEKGAHVIAADVSDEFQDALKKRIKDNNLKNIELRKIPYDGPALAEAEVDMVFIVNTYHHIENRVDYFAKVKRGIKPDGELVVIDFFKKELPVGPPVDHKIDLETVINELREAGFKIEINQDLLPYQFVITAK